MDVRPCSSRWWSNRTARLHSVDAGAGLRASMWRKEVHRRSSIAMAAVHCGMLMLVVCCLCSLTVGLWMLAVIVLTAESAGT